MSESTETPTPAAAAKTDLALAKLRQESKLAEFSSGISSAAGFEHYWRVAKMFAESAFVPAHFQGKPGDCLIALEMAIQMKEHALMLMQQSYLIKGRPGWYTQFYIARANRHGKLKSKVRWRIDKLTPDTLPATVYVSREAGKKTREQVAFPNLRVTAFATDEHGDEIEADVDTAMAIGEDWVSNPKYQTMFKHMMKWRSAGFLIRLHCPEVMMGMSTAEEMETLPSAFTSPPALQASDFEMLPEDPAPAAAAPDVGPQAESDPEPEASKDPGEPTMPAAASGAFAKELRRLGAYDAFEAEHGKPPDWPASLSDDCRAAIRAATEKARAS